MWQPSEAKASQAKASQAMGGTLQTNNGSEARLTSARRDQMAQTSAVAVHQRSLPHCRDERGKGSRGIATLRNQQTRTQTVGRPTQAAGTVSLDGLKESGGAGSQRTRLEKGTRCTLPGRTIGSRLLALEVDPAVEWPQVRAGRAAWRLEFEFG